MNTNERTNKRPVWRGELALLIVILINSFGVVLMLDLYLSGNSRSGPHDLTEKVCSYIPLQLRCRLRLQ